MTIDFAYIYPKHFYSAQDKNLEERLRVIDGLTEILKRAVGSYSPSTVILKDGNSFSGFLKTLHLNREGEGFAEFIESGKKTKRKYGFDEIASITLESD